MRGVSFQYGRGDKPWRALIKRNGEIVIQEYFATEKQAIAAAVDALKWHKPRSKKD